MHLEWIFRMLSIVSPSKDLDFKREYPVLTPSIPLFWNKSLELLNVLKTKKPKDLMKLMDISSKLAEENFNRYQAMDTEFHEQNSRPAIFAFSGDVYRSLDSYSMNKFQLDYCAKHLRILSGFYGLLKPSDLIQAYRLEMGTSIQVNRKKDLYEFWKETLTQAVQEEINNTKSRFLINLASQEYFSVLDFRKLSVPVIEIQFREWRNGKMQFLSFNAKKARGMMFRYFCEVKAKKLEDIKAFETEGYHFDEQRSSDTTFLFTR